MIKVQVRPNEPLEAALRRFKRQCNYAGVFRLSKKYSFYEKRSDKRRREERERIRNIQRAMRRQDGRTGVRGRRRAKLRSSSVTPDSARAAADAAAERDVENGDSDFESPNAVRISTVSSVTRSAEVSSAQENES